MDSNQNIKNILITGASGMLGRYLKDVFSDPETDSRIFSFGRNRDNDFSFDLTKDEPVFGGTCFDTVLHCAGTEDDDLAMELNYRGTQRLLGSLSSAPPKHFIYISSYRVYYPDAGCDITESCPTEGDGKTGESKCLAETYVCEWTRNHGVTLTIIRPARMFGSGVHGETLQLFKDAVNGSYIHIRGNDARVSLVTALDVARGIKSVYRTGGVFNAADGVNPRFIDMMEALSANAGRHSRMTHLPAFWAEWIWRLCRFIPAVDRNLNPRTASRRMKTVTIDGSRFSNTAKFEYHNTINVISRTDPDYPYAE